jgi:polysaccharide biosynthesis protein PslA
MFIAKSRELEHFAFTDGVQAYAPLSRASRPRPPSQRSVPTFDPPAFIAPEYSTPNSLKRLEDIVIASVALVLLSPVLLFAALMIRLTSPGPAIFRQQRVGLNGRAFTMLKFRTMHHQPKRPELLQATRNDRRVTWFGALLRRSSIDELPQLFNVVLGDMSVVGPRPHAPGTRAGGRLFEQVTHRYAARHCVKPGITGLAQVRGWRGETDTEEKLLRRLDCDLEYIATWNLRADLGIILRTAGAVLRMQNAY